MSPENKSAFDCIVLSNDKLSKDVWRLTLQPDKSFFAQEILPGQFVSLQPLDSSSVMIRPFGIANIIGRSELFILYKVVGKNTQLMTQLKRYQKIKVLGPLGNGLNFDSKKYDEVWLVGGGIGIAPLIYFEKVVHEKQHGFAKLFYGNQTGKDVIGLSFYWKMEINISTDDGTSGYHGFITDLFENKLQEQESKNILVISCGPNQMMKKVAEICSEYQRDCYLILEKVMACGIGTCRGCSCKFKSGQKSVCQDGPVFNAKEVIWNEL